MERIYCPKCDKLVQFDVKKCSEMYDVRKKKKIRITADVAHCRECGEKIFHELYDEENLRRVYRKYNELVSEEDRIDIDGE